jgi:hypothetical protein
MSTRVQISFFIILYKLLILSSPWIPVRIVSYLQMRSDVPCGAIGSCIVLLCRNNSQFFKFYLVNNHD